MLNKDEQDLTSKLSHELRNPLTIISSTLNLLESEYPLLQTNRFWKPLIQNVECMSHLLDEFSHLNHATTLHLSTFSFQTFLQYIAISFSASIANTKIQFSFEIDPYINQITGDKAKLQEVFLNLLKNAADAVQSQGNILLTAQKNNHHIVLSISDTGCGIPPRYLDSIFDPLVTHKKNGTGLGLAISKAIIDAHHGTIEVQSTPGCGSVFCIHLPIEQECQQEPCQ